MNHQKCAVMGVHIVGDRLLVPCPREGACRGIVLGADLSFVPALT